MRRIETKDELIILLQTQVKEVRDMMYFFRKLLQDVTHHRVGVAKLPSFIDDDLEITTEKQYEMWVMCENCYKMSIVEIPFGKTYYEWRGESTEWSCSYCGCKRRLKGGGKD